MHWRWLRPRANRVGEIEIEIAAGMAIGHPIAIDIIGGGTVKNNRGRGKGGHHIGAGGRCPGNGQANEDIVENDGIGVELSLSCLLTSNDTTRSFANDGLPPEEILIRRFSADASTRRASQYILAFESVKPQG